MKRLLIPFLLLLTIYGQAQKKGVLLFGNAAYQVQKTGDEKQSVLGFNLGLGYQFNREWAAGITTGLLSDEAKGPSEYERSALNIGPFVRFTRPISSLFSYYAQLEAGAVQGRTKDLFFGERKLKGAFVNIFPAIFVNIKNNFGLNFNLGGITYLNTKEDGVASRTEQLHVSLGQTFGVGISKIF